MQLYKGPVRIIDKHKTANLSASKMSEAKRLKIDSKKDVFMDENVNHFAILPQELLEEIFKYFHIAKELRLLTLVCHQFKDAIESLYGQGLSQLVTVTYSKVNALNAFEDMKDVGKKFTSFKAAKRTKTDRKCFTKTVRLASYLNLNHLYLKCYTSEEIFDILKLGEKTLTSLELHNMVALPDYREIDLNLERLQSLKIYNVRGLIPSKFLNYFTNLDTFKMSIHNAFEMVFFKKLAANSIETLRHLSITINFGWMTNEFKFLKHIETLKVFEFTLEYEEYNIEEHKFQIGILLENMIFAEDIVLTKVHIPEDLLQTLHTLLPNLKSLTLTDSLNEPRDVLSSHLPLKNISFDPFKTTESVRPFKHQHHLLTSMTIEASKVDHNMMQMLVEKLPSIDYFKLTANESTHLDWNTLRLISSWSKLKTLSIVFNIWRSSIFPDSKDMIVPKVRLPTLTSLIMESIYDMNYVFSILVIPKVTNTKFINCCWGKNDVDNRRNRKCRKLVNLSRMEHMTWESESPPRLRETFPNLRSFNIHTSIESGIRFLKKLSSKWVRGTLTMSIRYKYGYERDMFDHWDRIVEDIAIFHNLTRKPKITIAVSLGESIHRYPLENDGMLLNMDFEQLYRTASKTMFADDDASDHDDHGDEEGNDQDGGGNDDDGGDDGMTDLSKAGCSKKMLQASVPCN